MKIGVLIISHGSRDKSANQEFKKLVRGFQKRHPGRKVAHAFLEMARPSLPEVLETLALESKQIFVLPLFLFEAKHLKKHIPEILKAFQKTHPKVSVKLGKPLGADPLLLDILKRRLQQIDPP
jgi:sirohydrochlorin cobaltochelatase